MKKHLFILLLAFTCPFGYAQDVHFSQISSSAVLINPAACGAYNRDYRISLNYKDQWNSVTNSYKTMSASIEGKVLKTGRDKRNYLGIGLNALSDKAGIAQLNTTQANGYVAYNLSINRKSSFAAGIMGGFFQKKINIANLKWDNQFNGDIYDAARPTGESNVAISTTGIDLGAGLLWRYYDKNSQFKLDAGFSMSHLTRSKVSFYKANTPIHIKYIGHINSNIKLGDKPLFVCPQLFYAMQKPYSEFIVGTSLKYLLGEDSRSSGFNTFSSISSTIEFGVYYRMQDAFIVLASFELQKALSIGFSYDFNTSKLHNASKYKGGFEVSLIYKGLFERSNMKHTPLD